MTERLDRTILVVDDEPDLLSIIAEELKGTGFEVLCAESGSRALEVLANNKVDAVLSDVRMPDGDGLALFEAVKQRFENKIPFLFMTGFSDISVTEALKKGASSLIAKPFHMKELLSMLKQALD